jgi:ribosomal protein S27AE
MTRLSHKQLDTISRVAIAAWAIWAALELVSYFAGNHDASKLVTALLLGALICSQKAADNWRQAAKAWQDCSQLWEAIASGNNAKIASIAAQHPSITCPRCGRTSYHPKDIEQGYCGNCHDWTSSFDDWLREHPDRPHRDDPPHGWGSQ